MVQLDIEKFFNAVDPVMIIDALKVWGVDAKLCEMLKSHYTQLSYTCRLPCKSMGRPFALERGVPQGDPMSVMLANVAMRLAIAPLVNLRHTTLLMYVDDIFMYGTSLEELQGATDTVLATLTSIGFKVCAAKCGFAGCNVPAGQTLRIGERHVELSKDAEILGATFTFAGAQETAPEGSRTARREGKWIARMKRLKNVPGSVEYRSLVGMVTTQGLCYAPLCDRASDQKDRGQRRVLVDTLRGLAHRAPEEAVEIDLAVLARGQALDPLWNRCGTLL